MLPNLPAPLPLRRPGLDAAPFERVLRFPPVTSERKAPNPYSQEVHASMSDQKPSTPSDDLRNSYERKQDARRERLLNAADKAEREGDARIQRANQDSSAIPLGQPILVGHHSEKRDRNFRNRIHNNFQKGYELKNKAAELRGRAASVGKGGISSDDPAAVEKLEEELQTLEEKQQLYKAINKALRKSDRSGSDDELRALGLGDKLIEQLKKPDDCGERGIAPFQLSNNSANMRRIRKRIEALQAAADDQTTEEQHGEIRIVSNVEENRVQIFFPSTPSFDVRKKLKQNGFRWSPTAGAWQRHRSNAALWWARRCCGVE